MAINVFLQPCGLPAQRNFDITIKTPVPRDLILTSVSDSEKVYLSSVFRDLPQIATWGMIDSNNTSQQKAWRDVKRGDAVVFAGLKKILASGTFLGKVESTNLGSALYQPQKDGRGFEFIYFVDDVQVYEFVAWDEFRSVVGYKPHDRPHNARLLTGVKAQLALDWLRTYREPQLDSRVLETLKEFYGDDTEDLDEEGARVYRRQQLIERSRKNRELVLSKKGYICEVCGYVFADQFRGLSPSTHIHHKKPLAAGEQKDQAVSDFAVLCASCHTAAHMGPGRKLVPWPINELRMMITRRWDH